MAELPFFAGEEGRGHVLALLFFLSAAVITLWGTWEGTLPASDEAVLAETGREILVTDDPATMHFDGAPVYDTPPLAPWLMSFFYLIFGVNEFAARFAFVLLSCLSYYVVYLAGSAASRCGQTAAEPGPAAPAGKPPRCVVWGAFPAAVGVLAAAVFASTPLLGKFAPHVTLGLPFAFFTSLALLGWLSLPARGRGYFLWGAGVAGGILSVGGGAFLVVAGAVVASAIDRSRRGILRDPRFWIATAASVALGGLWLFPAAARGGAGFFSSPLLAPLALVVRPAANTPSLVLDSVRSVVLRSLPWSIIAVIAAARIVALRGDRRRAAAIEEVDGALLAFAAVIFAPLALAGAGNPSSFLPVVPFASILVAREVSRWLRRGGADPARRVWAVNHVMTALFSLLMLLVVATPLALRSTAVDPMESVARVAPRVAPGGEKIGNFRQEYREQCARMLFYGGRSLERPLAEPEEVAAALRANPSKVFLASSAGIEALRRDPDFPYEIRLLYGAGDLALFGIREAAAEEAP